MFGISGPPGQDWTALIVHEPDGTHTIYVRRIPPQLAVTGGGLLEIIGEVHGVARESLGKALVQLFEETASRHG
jgi:hypothetical protein